MSTIRVSRRWFSRYRTIQSALDQAPSGSVIEVEPGVYHEDLWIDRMIEIIGTGAKEEVVIVGKKYATIEMSAGYAVLKNLTLSQARTNDSPVVAVHRGALVLDGCDVRAEKGPGISIAVDEAEPILRRCRISSQKNAAILSRSRGKVLFEECSLHSESEMTTILVSSGDPVFRQCTITGTKGYGVFVEENGKGLFEECNLFGFDHSPAIGIDGGSPAFIRTLIHDGKTSGMVMSGGKAKFEECKIFSVGEIEPAIRVLAQAEPRFFACTIKNCPQGAFFFTNGAGGMIDQCDLYGFSRQPAIWILNEAAPHILQTRIHDGNKEAVFCEKGGRGIMENCELFGFNGDLVSIRSEANLDLLRCRIYRGQRHGVSLSLKATGTIRDTEIYDFMNAAAVHVSKAADPEFIQCSIHDSLNGVEVVENGRGSFDRCRFDKIRESNWNVVESRPVILDIEHGTSADPDRRPDPLSLLWQNWSAGMIGQTEMKRKLLDLIRYYDYLSDRKRLGIEKLEPAPPHAVFCGPPGIGKRKWAEFYGLAMNHLHFLSKGHLVSVDAAELLESPPEEAEERRREVTARTEGGVLYLRNPQSWAADAVSAGKWQSWVDWLIRLVNEEDADRIVILSGPEHPLKKWLNHVPELARKFQHWFEFRDYTPEELVQLFERMAEEENYRIDESARRRLWQEMNRICRENAEAGRAERVRHFFQMVKYRHGQRCAKIAKEERTRELLTLLLPEDLAVKKEEEVLPHDPEWIETLMKEEKQSHRSREGKTN
ncbi:right-handed parallel beta-helix repeat-containing protein [Thermoactinomyces sp. CICC 10523]|uniref:right-handed parallel beta-helix repeat-containing protein n=1 Tax=Thermoactinomyces sp. CICC 10523 TaxID=2767428 RepID=UPI0018DB41ED|nr:right-handed parallel beta-helix repeat-containing protein [Thermoactinomyces sp. CICC 10523]